MSALPDQAASSPLQTVDRALQILLSFSDGRPDWGVLELADEFGINKSTSQRLLAALATRGFLKADPYTRRYSLGPAMWHMANVWERGGGLARLADQVLTSLAAETERTALFTIPDGVHLRCIAAVDGAAGPVRSHALVGDLYPAHAGATSRAYFAFLEPHTRRALLNDRPRARFTELTEVDELAFEALLEETFAAGWAYSAGEYDSSTRAIAAPVRLGKTPIGSLSVLEPNSRADTDLRDMVPALLRAADDLSSLLSNRRPANPQRDWRRGLSRAPKP